MELSAEQLKVIEQKRLQAIELRKRRLRTEAAAAQAADFRAKYAKLSIDTLNKPNITGTNHVKATHSNILSNNQKETTNLQRVDPFLASLNEPQNNAQISRKSSVAPSLPVSPIPSNRVMQNSNPSVANNGKLTPYQIIQQAGRMSSGKKKQGNVISPMNEYLKNSTGNLDVGFIIRDNKRFEVRFRFNQALIDEIRKIPDGTFDNNSKNWCFPLENYKEIIQKITQIKLDRIRLHFTEGINDLALKAIIDSQAYNQIKVDLGKRLPSQMLRKMFDFQREGVEFGVKREGKVLIADDMGLGKTIQALALAWYYCEDWPLWVVCPSSVKFQWKESLLQWIPNLKDEQVFMLDSRRSNTPLSTYLVLITSYEMLSKVEQHIKGKPNTVIMDECHMIKDSSSQRSKIATKLVKKFKHIILLSGTPALSRPIELYTQLNLLRPDIFKSKQAFGMRYCDGKLGRFGYDYKGSSNPEELNVLLKSTVMIRRLKKDVLSELPPKLRVKVSLDPNFSEKHKSEMQRFLDRFKNLGSNPEAIAKNSNFLEAYVKTAEMKLEATKGYLKSLLEKGKKFICFAHHRSMMSGIEDFLNQEKILFIKIDGNTTAVMRKECCDFFQTRDDCRVALLSITAAGVGLTLTAANIVVFTELYYNPGILHQAEDRAHRIGQNDSVLIHYLVCKGTADDHLWPLINGKMDVLGKVGLCNENFESMSGDIPTL